MSTRDKILLFVLGTLGLCSWSCWRYGAADRDFEKLLKGSNNVVVVSLEIEKSDILIDPPSLNYLSEMFRFAQVIHGEGPSDIDVPWAMFVAHFHAEFRLSTDAIITCAVRVSIKKDLLILHFPLDDFDEGKLYLVTLKKPLPELLFVLLSKQLIAAQKPHKP